MTQFIKSKPFGSHLPRTMDPIHEDFINPSDVSGSNFPTSGQPYNWRMRQPTSDKISAASSSAQLEAEQNNGKHVNAGFNQIIPYHSLIYAQLISHNALRK
jgi:hypothetical protein